MKSSGDAKHIRRRIESVLVVSLFVTPLLMYPWGQSLTGRIKDVAMWLTAGVLSLLFAALWRVQPNSLRFPRNLTRGTIPWLIVLAVSAFAAVSPTTAIWSALGAVPLCLIALATAYVGRRPLARERLIRAWVASAGLVSAYAIVQHYGWTIVPWPTTEPLRRASGTIGAPTFLASFQALALPFAVALWRLRRVPYWLAPAIGAIVAALVVTYSRGAWAAAVLGVLVTLYATNRPSRTDIGHRFGLAVPILLGLMSIAYFLNTLVAPIAALVALSTAVWVWSLRGFRPAVAAITVGLIIGGSLAAWDSTRPETKAKDRLATSADSENESLFLRGLAWQASTLMVQQRPWLGWGPDGFRVGATAVAHDTLLFTEALLYPHQNAHNEWYTAAVDSGIPGLITWTLLLIVLTNTAADRARVEREKSYSRGVLVGRRAAVAGAVLGAMVAFVFQGLVTPRAPTTLLGLALCWGMAAAIEPVEWRRRRSAAPAVQFALPVGAAACVIVAAVILVSDTYAGIGASAVKAGRYDVALPALRAAARWNPMDPDYARAWGETAQALADRTDGRVRKIAALQALEAYQTNLRMEPANGTWHAGAAQALAHLDPPRALEAGVKGVELSPLSANAWWSLSRVTRAMGDTPREMSLLRAAISVDPVAPEPAIRLAQIFRSEDRPELSERLLTWAADNWTNSEDLAPWRGRVQARVAR